jgi:hypothetical protein
MKYEYYKLKYNVNTVLLTQKYKKVSVETRESFVSRAAAKWW